ncbi:MAG TPA: phosphotransferase family protein [Pyrinomonadaceae bacterium]|nr:phosphotransferase family protein [Pyrinomonadaceae bacterium]
MTETLTARAGEELDANRLSHFLTERLGHSFDRIEVEQFPAGSSNLTYLIRSERDDYVLRRPPFGNTVRSAHDMHREFSVLSKLSTVYSPAPRPILFCNDESVIGSEFYLMERRRGLILRGATPSSLSESPRLQRQVCKSFIDNLAYLHSIDYKAAGLSDLGNPVGYPRRQVEGWTKRYFYAKTHEWPELERAAEWLDQNIPNESGASILHNDYKFDNVMLDPTDLAKIAAVLDWEMVTVGDPLMDLGTTLGYWVGREGGEAILNMPFNPRVFRETIPRQELVDMYRQASGRDVSNILYYFVFGLFKVAGIAQQIYARYVKGHTQDERFRHFDKFVQILGRIADSSINAGSI